MNSGAIPSPPAGGGEPPDNGELGRQVSVLQARFDTVLPTLATKSDLADLRAELRVRHEELRTELRVRHEELRAELQRWSANLFKWMLATVIGMLLCFSAFFFGLSNLLTSRLPAPIPPATSTPRTSDLGTPQPLWTTSSTSGI